MAFAYQPPGVTVQEEVTPSINPLLAAPANVCVVGRSLGYIQRTDVITLNGTDEVELPGLPLNATLVDPVVSVLNASDPLPEAGYVEDTDYQVFYSNAPVNEVQTVTLTSSTGGTFTLSWGDETTANIAYNATAAAVESALEALNGIGPNDVTVSGSNGGPYTVTFGGQYAGRDLAPLVADGTNLTGSGHAVAVTQATEGRSGSAIVRIGGGDIPTGATVYVTYRYIPEDYFRPTRLNEISSIEARYGSALDSTGKISSEVSFAAACAFENGASEIVIQPLFRRAVADDPDSALSQPTETQIPDATTWEQSLFGLRDIEDVNIIVPAVGQSYSGDQLSDSEQLAIIQKVQDHIKYMRDQQQYIVGIFGEDSSADTSVASKDVLRGHAASLQSRYGGTVNEQLVLVSPSRFTRTNSVTGLDFNVGGQYFAAGLAGLIAGQAVSAGITRKVVSGFTAIPIRRYSKQDQDADAANGLTVAVQSGIVTRIRHAVTLDTTATARREISVVRAKHRMIESVRDTLENSVIGQVIADGEAPTVVGAAVRGVLEQLKIAKDLVDYSDVQARTLTLDPTTVEVRYSYKPAFPLNYVRVVFSLDITPLGDISNVTAITI